MAVARLQSDAWRVPSQGTTRVEIELMRDFGSEDLLLVQRELLDELAAALQVDVERFAIAQAYAAGQYYILDVLPPASSGGAEAEGQPSSDELLERFVSLGTDGGSSLYDGRALGLLNGLKRLDGLGSAVVEHTLLEGLQVT